MYPNLSYLLHDLIGTDPDNWTSIFQTFGLLMALANKKGGLLLTTGNKSEYAVGYATIYGDMCGGYNVLKDIYKTKIYD